MSEYKITTALITTMVVTWLTTASGALAETLALLMVRERPRCNAWAE